MNVTRPADLAMVATCCETIFLCHQLVNLVPLDIEEELRVISSSIVAEVEDVEVAAALAMRLNDFETFTGQLKIYEIYWPVGTDSREGTNMLS